MYFGTASNLSTYEKNMVAHHRKNWFSEVKKASEFRIYKGDKLDKKISHHPKFLSIITYISEAFEIVSGNRKGDPPLLGEVSRYEQEGKLCVYLSILTYTLLMHHGITNDREMKYVQGYYHHKNEATNWIAGLLGNEHVGSHAWITIGKAVIDISIKQEENFFQFDGYPAILGEVPPRMLLKGFSEPKKTVNKYVEHFAKQRKLSIDEWIAYHNQQMENLLKKQTS
ncbi:hypothetical protein NDS46_31550 (plasmid) [Paenibacillus thiaminolyticus]|uniref:hypothetical protein n=1 Tax=Paenibacillus thiaminolyticus TaxID=49283 RepID=UPI00232B9D53|nr:hypothetical protein [Paenibacillus thiaminolyticus]WCF11494.1 hypothetical protein NDS46_31550 [Paenibacillus thiaminolyticus]